MTNSNDFQIYLYDSYIFVQFSGPWDGYGRKRSNRPFSKLYQCAVHLLSINYVKYRPDCDVVAVAGNTRYYCYHYFLLLLLFESKKCVLTCSRHLDNKYVGMHRTYEKMRALNPRVVRGLTETKRR